MSELIHHPFAFGELLRDKRYNSHNRLRSLNLGFWELEM